MTFQQMPCQQWSISQWDEEIGRKQVDVSILLKRASSQASKEKEDHYNYQKLQQQVNQLNKQVQFLRIEGQAQKNNHQLEKMENLKHLKELQSEKQQLRLNLLQLGSVNENLSMNVQQLSKNIQSEQLRKKQAEDSLSNKTRQFQARIKSLQELDKKNQAEISSLKLELNILKNQSIKKEQSQLKQILSKQQNEIFLLKSANISLAQVEKDLLMQVQQKTKPIQKMQLDLSRIEHQNSELKAQCIISSQLNIENLSNLSKIKVLLLEQAQYQRKLIKMQTQFRALEQLVNILLGQRQQLREQVNVLQIDFSQKIQEFDNLFKVYTQLVSKCQDLEKKINQYEKPISNTQRINLIRLWFCAKNFKISDQVYLMNWAEEYFKEIAQTLSMENNQVFDHQGI